MPEGDVVARVARALTENLAGQKVTSAELRWPNLAGIDLSGWLIGETTSYGKHLFTHFDNERILHSHLRMDGMWRFKSSKIATPKDHRLRAVISTSSVVALGWQLGMMHLIQPREVHTLIGHLGIDLMGDDPKYEQAVNRLSLHQDRPIGACLLDQTISAGIGTIYMAETLWLYRINPWRPANEIEEPEKLFHTASALMKRSASGQHLTATGDWRPGYDTAVHGRENKPCRRCDGYITKKPIGDPPYERPAFYCPHCQSL